MNLFEDLSKLYDANLDKVGVVAKKNVILLPVYHCGMSAQITITIDMDGSFKMASIVDDEHKFTVIPCTIDSQCRSSNSAPHACNDRIDYLSGNMSDYFALSPQEQERNRKRYNAYKNALEQWAESPFANPKIQAIWDYIKNDTLLHDLASSGILEYEGAYLNPKQKINKVTTDTIAIRFSVLSTSNISSEDYIPETWLDPEMFESYIGYYQDIVNKSFPWDYCYVTGEYVPIADKHSNGIRTNSDFAKLISANENGLIVYTGDKFHTAKEALTIGYLTSLKAHNALRWLISLQGIRNGENITLAWHQNGTPVKVLYQTDTPGAYGDDAYTIAPNKNEYCSRLDSISAGLISSEDENQCIHFLELDSSFKGDLKGRIAILDYSVYPSGEYYANVLSWHKKYFWNIRTPRRFFTGSPSIYDIVVCAYGIESQNSLVVLSHTLFAMCYNRLIKSIIFGRRIPADFIQRLCTNASHPMKYKLNRSKVLTVACAIINGERGGGEFMLDKENNNRDYLFGRLLAVANFAERATFNTAETGRETNAIRYMSDYAIAPATTWNRINGKLQPYLRKLNRNNSLAGEEYRILINNITDMFDLADFSDTALSPLYLLGFSSQGTDLDKRAYARSKSKENNSTS